MTSPADELRAAQKLRTRALAQGSEQAMNHFTTWGSEGSRWGNQQLEDFPGIYALVVARAINEAAP